jgi:hypothetical protein
MGFPVGTNPLTTPIITPVVDIPSPTILITDAGLVDPDKDVGQTHNAWQRIEPVPLSPDLTFALQASVADPAWMLCRQWQFSRVRGGRRRHTTASAHRRRSVPHHAVRTRQRRFTSASRARPYNTEMLPLEVTVEREPIGRIIRDWLPKPDCISFACSRGGNCSGTRRCDCRFSAHGICADRRRFGHRRW